MMKKIRSILLFLFLPGFAFSQNLKVMSYNIRYDNPDDGMNKWGKRKADVAKSIHKYDPDIIGTQEVLNNQLNDLNALLPEYESFGVERDDGKQKGEYAAIFFRKKEFIKLDGNFFWLSETPDIAGSKSWDAALTRMVTWCKLMNKKTGKNIFVFNTHFDHVGKIAREKSAILIKEKIKEIAGNNIFILTGDLNTEPFEEAYQNLMNKGDKIFIDVAGEKNSEGTFCGFDVKNKKCKRIDYIFCSMNLEPINYFVIHDNNGTYYPSDHVPVMAEIKY